MQKHNNIKAFLFLGIFSILLLHQVLPHLHHEHDLEHTHEAVAHGHSQSHHHNEPEKENPNKGFLDFFLEMHAHSVVTTEVVLAYESNKSIQHFKVKRDINTAVSVIPYQSSINYDEAKIIKVYHPPNTYSYTNLLSLDSRGPPSLG